jgi:hypothetical protein
VWLKRGKGDENKIPFSDHLINTDDVSHIFLSLLFICMLCHGHPPPPLLPSTFISIPQNPQRSLCDSTNYRSIAPCSCLCKLFDVIVICKWRDRLITSDLQFGFKSQHSTVLCTAMYKEAVQYFVNRRSTVYSVLLDARKAFDKVHYGTL